MHKSKIIYSSIGQFIFCYDAELRSDIHMEESDPVRTRNLYPSHM